jgi:hypothetical protein
LSDQEYSLTSVKVCNVKIPTYEILTLFEFLLWFRQLKP